MAEDSHLPTSTIEESAIRMSDQGGEGDYVDEIFSTQAVDSLTELLNQARGAAEKVPKLSMRETILEKLDLLTDTLTTKMKKGQLKVGKKRSSKGISQDNVVQGKRKVGKTNKHKSSKGHQHKVKKGDKVSLPSSAFDGDDPGSFSSTHPDPCYGNVVEILQNGLAIVRWEGGEKDQVRVSDLKLEARKASILRIIVMLAEGSQLNVDERTASIGKESWPKDFFEVLIRSDWRAWVEAVKKELTGWDTNKAVTVVEMSDLPPNAKIVPLGELYTIKRDGGSSSDST